MYYCWLGTSAFIMLGPFARGAFFLRTLRGRSSPCTPFRGRAGIVRLRTTFLEGVATVESFGGLEGRSIDDDRTEEAIGDEGCEARSATDVALLRPRLLFRSALSRPRPPIKSSLEGGLIITGESDSFSFGNGESSATSRGGGGMSSMNQS